MLLIDVRCGDKIKIKEILGNEAVLKKIEAMGLRKGDTFEVIQRWGRNLLVRNGNNRLVISSDIAKNIEIELIETAVPSCEIKSHKGRRKRWRWGWFK
uniref:Ferrous iron transport protein A n=1 Tax=Thermodesulfobacterium geofontis TaxID=1295609 RepID=A0A7V4N3R6_9BACT